MLPSQKCRYFVPVPAHRHRTPPPLAGPRVIIKKQAALRIRTALHGRRQPFYNKLRCRARNRCEQPLKPIFPRHKLQPPLALVCHQFVMAFGDPQNFVDGCDPCLRKFPSRFHRRKDRPNAFPQPQDFQQYRVYRCRLAPRETLQPQPALLAHDS